jgi:hypothetical protein
MAEEVQLRAGVIGERFARLLEAWRVRASKGRGRAGARRAAGRGCGAARGAGR